MKPSLITVCDTCKREGWDPEADPRTDGEKFAEMIERHAAGVPQVRTRRHACLMGCTHGCNIAVQAEDKIAYVLGRFDPSEDSASGVVDYARLHAESATGQVPFRSWPAAVKGHFVTRLPSLPVGRDPERG